MIFSAFLNIQVNQLPPIACRACHCHQLVARLLRKKSGWFALKQVKNVQPEHTHYAALPLLNKAERKCLKLALMKA